MSVLSLCQNLTHPFADSASTRSSWILSDYHSGEKQCVVSVSLLNLKDVQKSTSQNMLRECRDESLANECQSSRS